MPNLTANAITAILNGDIDSRPIVQVLYVNSVLDDRYRLLISDGVLNQHVMLATKLNELVRSGKVIVGSVIQLINYVCHTDDSSIQTIVVVNMETILRKCVINPKLIPEPVPAKQKEYYDLVNVCGIVHDTYSTMELCDDPPILEQKFSITPISEIENAENNYVLDVLGVVVTVNPSVPILRKNGMETQRRDLKLKDQSERSVELTMWGEFCNKEGQKLQEMVDSGLFPVVAIKAGKVSGVNGKSIWTISSSQIFINPDSPEAIQLRQWFDGGGKDLASQSISRDLVPGASRNDREEVEEEGEGENGKCDDCERVGENGSDWVFCDCCKKWFHTECLRTTLEAAKKAKKFFCSSACAKSYAARI